MCLCKRKFLALLEKIQRLTSIGILFITHDLRVASRICDRVIVMHQGRIVEEGLVSDVFLRLGKTIRGACSRQRLAETFRLLGRQTLSRIRQIRKASTSGFVVRPIAKTLDANACDIKSDPWTCEYPPPSCRKSV